ncbi:hypothetical protein ACOMHN_034558 [Nucella lapillus]
MTEIDRGGGGHTSRQTHQQHRYVQRTRPVEGKTRTDQQASVVVVGGLVGWLVGRLVVVVELGSRRQRLVGTEGAGMALLAPTAAAAKPEKQEAAILNNVQHSQRLQ